MGEQILYTKIELPDKLNKQTLVFTLDNVFSPEECAEWIQLTESKGYEAALLNVGQGAQVLNTKLRQSQRCIIDSEEMAMQLWQRVAPFVPQTWNSLGKDYEVVGLNERLRFLKYFGGDYFAPHVDGCYMRPDDSGEMSFVTLQLYLNTGSEQGLGQKIWGLVSSKPKYDFEGGATTFLGLTKDVPCVPKTGRVLIFQHNILHEGSKVVKGIKYAMRTDIMYRPKKVEQS